MGILEPEGTEQIFEVIMAINFIKLVKETKPQTPEAQRMLTKKGKNMRSSK